MKSKRIGVLVSGRGSNLQALLGASSARALGGEIAVVISNVESAPSRFAWANPSYDLSQSSIVPCHRDLLAALRGKGVAETTGADNLKTMELVFAAYESEETNSVVTFPTKSKN